MTPLTLPTPHPDVVHPDGLGPLLKLVIAVSAGTRSGVPLVCVALSQSSLGIIASVEGRREVDVTIDLRDEDSGALITQTIERISYLHHHYSPDTGSRN